MGRRTKNRSPQRNSVLPAYRHRHHHHFCHLDSYLIVIIIILGQVQKQWEKIGLIDFVKFLHLESLAISCAVGIAITQREKAKPFTTIDMKLFPTVDRQTHSFIRLSHARLPLGQPNTKLFRCRNTSRVAVREKATCSRSNTVG